MISILLPSRKRPNFLKRMVDSAREMSLTPPEIVVYIDDDDKDTLPMAEELGLVTVIGPRITMTDYWNKCYEKATNDIVMQAGDDIMFRTKGWDKMVEDEFEKWPDKLVLIHGDDLDPNFRNKFGTHSLLHRRWIETLGYFVPPYFSSDNGDRWLMAVANFLNRRVYLPFITEHLHFRTGKAVIDSTYAERLKRHDDDKPDQLYADMIAERLADAAKLQDAIEAFQAVSV